MYKLLIVEDEPLVQVGLKSMLNWESHDIEVMGIASNGKIASEIIQKEMPDIVITDIKMPIMSGLELVKHCKETYPVSPEFIILTSYEDFSMAREAISYHVQDYLIKIELTPSLLEESIGRAIKSRNEKLPQGAEELSVPSISFYREKFYIQLLNNLFEDSEQFKLQANELKLSFDADSYIVTYCEITNLKDNSLNPDDKINLYHSTFQMTKELLSQYQNNHVIPLDLYHFAIIFYFGKDMDLAACNAELTRILTKINTSLFNYYMTSLICGSGNMVANPMEISESYQRARFVFTKSDINNNYLAYEDASDKPGNFFNFSILKDTFSSAFEEYDSKTFKGVLDEVTELFSANPHHYLQAIDFSSNLLYLANSLLPNGESVVADMFEDNYDYLKLYKMKNMEQVLEWLNNFSTSLCEFFDSRKKEVRKPIVLRAKSYIKGHITDRLSLSEVAAALCISPNYLSQLFKKYNDMGFNDYVTKCKIEEAKQYLKEGNLCIYEIAENLGFESSFYFSKVFKKVEGISPSDFQKK